MLVNERLLNVIVALSEDLHFGRAAARLHVSQSALSGTVRNLERDLGVRLFERTSRHVALTESGLVFVAEARRLLQDAQRAVLMVRERSSDVSGPLRIGYSAACDIRWICSIAARARTEGVLANDLQLVSCEAVDLYNEIVKGAVHAAFVAGPWLPHPEVHHLPLFHEPMTVALASSHPLAGLTEVTFRQLSAAPVIWLRRDLNPMLYQSFIGLCSSQEYRPQIVQEVRTFYECIEFTREMLGISFVPRFMRTGGLDDGIAFARLPEADIVLEYALAFRKRDHMGALGPFVKLMQEEASNRNRFESTYTPSLAEAGHRDAEG